MRYLEPWRKSFIASKQKDQAVGVRKYAPDLTQPVRHPDGRSMSICTQYLRWMFGADAILDSKQIDIWHSGTELYLFL